MAATDLIIGGYFLPMMVAVYGSLAAPALLSRWLRTRAEIRGEQRWSGQLARVAGWVACGLGCSLLFFFASNFAVWLFSPFHAFAYPLTIAGLIECYAMALPFFRFTLAGDLLTSCVLFGGYAAVINLRRSPSVAAA
jgi:hypothetical protein